MDFYSIQKSMRICEFKIINSNIKFSKQEHLLKWKPHIIFALLKIIAILPTFQGKKKLFFTSEKVNENTKGHLRSGWLAETRGYNNIYFLVLQVMS